MSGEDYRVQLEQALSHAKDIIAQDKKSHCLCPGHQWGLF